jgi:hypothetical protein
LITVDEDDYLSLTLPEEGHDEQHRLFHRWREEACGHRGMVYAYEHIGTWWEVNEFRHALTRAGSGYALFLLSALPTANGGSTPHHDAVAILDELQVFVQHDTIGDTVTIRDTETNNILRSQDGSLEGEWFMAFNPWRLGFDQGGIFVHRLVDPPLPLTEAFPGEDRPGVTRPSRATSSSDTIVEVFRSSDFHQELLHGEHAADDRGWWRPMRSSHASGRHDEPPFAVRLTDAASHTEVILPFGISSDDPQGEPYFPGDCTFTQSQCGRPTSRIC